MSLTAREAYEKTIENVQERIDKKVLLIDNKIEEAICKGQLNLFRVEDESEAVMAGVLDYYKNLGYTHTSLHFQTNNKYGCTLMWDVPQEELKCQKQRLTDDLYNL